MLKVVIMVDASDEIGDRNSPEIGNRKERCKDEFVSFYGPA